MSLKKIHFIYIGVFLLCFTLLNSIYLKIGIICISCLWFLLHKEYTSFVVYCISISCLVAQNYLSYPLLEDIQGTVESVREGSFVVKVGGNRIWVNSDIQVNFDDVVVVNGELQEISSNKNRVGFSFEKWCKSQKISYQCYADEVKVIKKGTSLRAAVYHMMDTFPKQTKEIMKMFLFHIYDVETEWLYLGLSFGIHISYLLYMIKKYMSLFFLENDVDWIVFLCNVCIAFFYHMDFICVRHLIHKVLKKSGLDKKSQWGVLTSLLILFYPELVREMKFLMPVLIGLVQAFSEKKVMGIGDCIFSLLQLWFYGYVSLLQILWAKCIRPFFSFMYVMCFVRIWIPFDMVFKVFYYCLEQIQSLDINGLQFIGKPNVFVFIVVIICLIRYVVLFDKKYLILIGLLFLINGWQNYYQFFARVVYLDVGQGDSTLIILPFHKGNILVDTGGSMSYDIASEVVYPVLASYGISSLDAVILTHDDLDHSGAYDSLNQLIPIKQTIDGKQEKYVVNTFVMYDGLYKHEYDDRNENSLTLCYELYGSTFLILGDIAKKQEEVFVNIYKDLQIDYLKLAHHGSNTSTSTSLLESVKPTYALISVGKNNRYGHPSEEVLERLMQYKIPFLTTANEGAIEICCYPFSDFIHTISGKRIWLKKMRE